MNDKDKDFDGRFARALDRQTQRMEDVERKMIAQHQNMGVQHIKTQFEIQRFGDKSSKGQQKCIENVTKASESDKLNVGERVVISGQEHGTLRYLGPTHFQVRMCFHIK